MPAFQFSLQPALDDALRLKSLSQEELDRACRQVNSNVAAWEATGRKIEEIAQRLQEAGDNLNGVATAGLSAIDLLARRRDLEAVHREHRQLEEQAVEQQADIRFAKLQQQFRQQELIEASTRAEVLRRLHDQELAEFRQNLLRAEEAALDETVMSRATYRASRPQQ